MKILLINTKYEPNSMEHAMLSKIALTITASILTITGITIAIMSGMSLGTGLIDRFVYISIAVSSSLITQFLPARQGGVKKWLIFSLAAFVTMSIHMSYYATSTTVTGEAKAANSEAVTRVTQRVTALTAERDAIVSRSVTIVTAELSLEHNSRIRAALKSELSEAHRKIKLSEKIETLKGDLVTTTVTNTSNPLTNLVTQVFSVTNSLVTLIHSFAFFVLTEISAAFLWRDLLQKEDYTNTTGKRHIIDAEKQEEIVALTEISDRDLQLLKLSQDIREGNCNATVREIRKHLRCSMNRAMELARIVKV